MEHWFTITNIDEVDSPSLAVYPDRVKHNIDTVIKSIDDIGRLRPHVKTHKSSEVARMMLGAGITKFKCATIAEAEMLAHEGAPDVLLAYQPVGPKADRLARLVDQYTATRFSCLIDNISAAQHLSDVLVKHDEKIDVYVDLNVGMNRTGILPDQALNLIRQLQDLSAIHVAGLHAYDGHLRDHDLNERKRKCDEGFTAVEALQRAVKSSLQKDLIIVAGGTPTFSIHKNRKDVECSPGTFIYWDKGYGDLLHEQHYDFAALVITRVVSQPSPGIICVDLGHKAIASENPLANRVFFLNGEALTPIGHSEEHLILRVDDDTTYAIGDVLYGVPYHICPTVALHQSPAIVIDGTVKGYWATVSRNRMITI